MAERTLTPVTDGPIAPDHDEQAEQALLGCALTNPTALDHLDPGDLYLPKHQTIADTITKLHTNGDPTGPIAVAATLRASGDLTRTGGGPYLFDLTQAACTPTQAPFYARIITTHAHRRRIRAVLTRATQQLDQASDPITIETTTWTALSNLTDPTRRTRTGLTLTDFTELLSTPNLPTEWLARPLLAAGRITLLYAPGKTGKSLIAMEAAAALATGRPCLSSPGGERHHVLYVDQEMTPNDWRERLTDMHFTPTDGPDLTEYLHLAQLHTWPALDTHEGGQALLHAADTLHARIVIIDTISKVLQGPENDNDTASAFYRHTVVPLKAAGIAVLVIDHTGKDIEKGARGGSAKTDNVDLVLELLSRSNPGAAEPKLTMKATHTRFADESLEQPTFLIRQRNPLKHIVENNAERSEKLIEVCLGHFRKNQVPASEPGNKTLADFRKEGLKFTTDTFYEARRRYQVEIGWE